MFSRRCSGRQSARAFVLPSFIRVHLHILTCVGTGSPFGHPDRGRKQKISPETVHHRPQNTQIRGEVRCAPWRSRRGLSIVVVPGRGWSGVWVAISW